MMTSREDQLRGTLQGSRSKSITLLQVATDSADNNSATVYPENAPTEVSSNSETAELEVSILDDANSAVGDQGGGRSEGAWSPLSLSSPSSTGSGSKYVHIIQEIIETEKTYVHDLNDVIEGYETQCIDVDLFDNDDDFVALFANIDELYEFNKSLLQQLQEADGDPVSIGRCFIENAQNFRQYTLYCTNYPTSVAALARYTQSQNNIADFFKACQTNLGHALPLGSYLLKPVQRILKYRLLLMQLVKEINVSSEGNAILEEALATMTSVAEHINEMKKLHESIVRVQEIQSQLRDWKGDDLNKYGRLVLEDQFRVSGARDPRIFFLFEKLLLVTKRREDGEYYCKSHFESNDLMLTESVGKELTSFQLSQYSNVKNVLTIHTKTVEVKQKWVATIRRLVIDSWPDLPPKARKIVLGIQEGKDAVPPPLSFSPNELPVLKIPIGNTVRRKLERSRSTRQDIDKRRRKKRAISIPEYLLASTLPGDISESRVTKRETSKLEVITDDDVFDPRPSDGSIDHDFSNLVFEDSNVGEGAVTPETKIHTKVVDEEAEEMKEPTPPVDWRVRDRAKRVNKEDLQKLRESRAVLRYRSAESRMRAYSVGDFDSVGEQASEKAESMFTDEQTQTIAAIGTLPRASVSPFARKPVVKKRGEESPLVRRRNAADRKLSRRKKTQSMLYVGTSTERVDGVENHFEMRSGSLVTCAGDLASERFRPDGDARSNKNNGEDSDNGWDVTIVDAIFQKYTKLEDEQLSNTEGGDQSGELDEDPFLSPIAPHKLEETSNETSRSERVNPIEISQEEQLVSNGFHESVNDEASSVSEVEQSAAEKNGMEQEDVKVENEVSRSGTTEVAEKTVGWETEEWNNGNGETFVHDEAFAYETCEVEWSDSSVTKEEQIESGNATKEKSDELTVESLPSTAVVMEPSDETVGSLSQANGLHSSLNDILDTSLELAKEAEMSQEKVCDERDVETVDIKDGKGGEVMNVVMNSETNNLGDAVVDNSLEISESPARRQDEKETSNDDISKTSEVRSTLVPNDALEADDSDEADGRSEIREEQGSELQLEPESIADVGDVDDAMAALSNILPSPATEEHATTLRPKKEEKPFDSLLMMSLEEALEMDQLPHSDSEVTEAAASSSRTRATVKKRDRRKSSSLTELQVTSDKQEKVAPAKSDKPHRNQSEPTAQKKERPATKPKEKASVKHSDKNPLGKVKLLARNYSRMLKGRVQRTQSAQPSDSPLAPEFVNFPKRKSNSAHNSPGIGRRLAEIGLNMHDFEESADNVDMLPHDSRSTLRSRPSSAPQTPQSSHIEEVSDSTSLSSEASGGQVRDDGVEDEEGKVATPVRGWVKKVASKFQAK